MIPLADERTNHAQGGAGYGLALHSLTERGRGFIARSLESLKVESLNPEGLAVLHHELDLMQTGAIAESESRIEGNFHLALPLGIVRRNGFTAGLSALRALNREIAPESHYALDQQNMVYLSHRECGPILTGVKSKHAAEFSTFRIDDDAYTVKTGTLKLGDGWAEAHLYYLTFEAWIRWELADAARLILKTDTDRMVTTAFPIAGDPQFETAATYTRERLRGFSPYSEGNVSTDVPAVVFRWTGTLELLFRTRSSLSSKARPLSR